MRNAFRWYDYVLLGLMALYLLWGIQQMPLFYDEAYNLQVPLMLLREQKYDTIYHMRAFDGFTTITTGPTVLVPTFWVFRFFGVGVLRARIVQYLYIVATLGMLWLLFVRYFNRGIGFSLILILYSVPQLRLMLSVMGEIPAIFFILTGIALWGQPNRMLQNIAVFIMGLSVITKLYFGLVLLPLLMFIVIRAVQSRKPIELLVKEALIASLLFMLPLLIFEAVKLIWLGGKDYLLYFRELVDFGENQHMSWESFTIGGAIQFAVKKFAIFSRGLFPGFPVCFVGVLCIGITIAAIKRMWLDVDRHLELSLSFLIFVTYLLWFMFVDASNWWRHISPFGILFLLLLGDVVNTILKFFSGYRPAQIFIIVILLSLFGLCVMPFAVKQHANFQTFPYQLNSQKEFADEVNKYLDRGYQIAVDGWWQAPEIAFLAGGAKFLPFNCSLEFNEKYLVIYTVLEEILDPEHAKILKSCLGEKLFESEDKAYILYRPLVSQQQ